MNKTCFIWMSLVCVLCAAARAAWAAPVTTRPQQSLKPRGVRLQIRAVLSITNSGDGFRDNQVEAYGMVNFNSQNVWNVASKDAINMTSKSRNILLVAERTFDVIYNDASTWTLKVNGFINDHDKGIGDDTMWNPRNQIHEIKLKQLSRANRIATLTLTGDRKEESVDLIFAIIRDKYLY